MMSSPILNRDVKPNYVRVVLPHGEVVYKCASCPCVFSTMHDVELHVASCHKGNRVSHRHGFKYGYIGLCYKGKSGRPVSVKYTISNVLLCRGCRYFVETEIRGGQVKPQG